MSMVPDGMSLGEERDMYGDDDSDDDLMYDDESVPDYDGYDGPDPRYDKWGKATN